MRERGAALICSLLCMTLLLALGLSLLLSTTTDTLMSNSFRSSGEAFFAADGGIAVGRLAVRRALAERITAVVQNKDSIYSATQTLPDSVSAPDAPFFKIVGARAEEIANDAVRSSYINNSKYQIEVISFTGGPDSRPARNPGTGVENYTFLYTIKAMGRSARAARAEVLEHGELHAHVTAAASVSRKPFSRYATFFDVGDPKGKLVLVSGTFTGWVHTNSHFNFSSKNNVTFRGKVTQVDTVVGYDREKIPIEDVQRGAVPGIIVSEGQYKVDKSVPLPRNNFSQEIATVNPTGNATDASTQLTPNGRVSTQYLAQNLAGVDGLNPPVSGNSIPTGVYLGSVDGTSLTGGGIYVRGDAGIELSTNGRTQVVQVRQGSTTTTIRMDYESGMTTMSNGSTSRTFIGVPQDGTVSVTNPVPGTSLFVDGSITALSGPPAVDGVTPPAIGRETALTITAQRDITVTGDVKYSDPVVSPTGTPSAGSDNFKMSLGIYTNNGNIQLDPDKARTDGNLGGLEIDAALMAVDSNPLDNSGRAEGTILYTGAHNPGPKARLKIVGCRIQSNISDIKFKSRQVYYDPRFENGEFAPPFYPGIEIKDSGRPPTISFDGEQSIVLLTDSWQRDIRRKKKNS
jgi:hypothetical protein